MSDFFIKNNVCPVVIFSHFIFCCSRASAVRYSHVPWTLNPATSNHLHRPPLLFIDSFAEIANLEFSEWCLFVNAATVDPFLIFVESVCPERLTDAFVSFVKPLFLTWDLE